MNAVADHPAVSTEYRTLQTIVTDRLRTAIVSGRFSPGTRLQQDDLARELGVSRMPIREALRVLHTEGLVEFEPHRGATVIELRADDIAEIFDIRTMLEARAAELAAPNLAETTLAELRRLCEAMADPALDDGAWLSLNREFHTLIYPASGWPRLCALIVAQRNVMQPYLRAITVLIGRRETAQVEHRQIVDAATRRDGPALAALTVEHLRTTAIHLINYLAARPASPERSE
jgi:DNA-binding GntR family transcriptional regulator